MAPPSPPPADWHDNPGTPGEWRWHREGSLSIARFGSPQRTLFSLICNQNGRVVTLSREGQSAAAPVLSIRTTSLSRKLAMAGGAGDSFLALPARDPLLDAMAFSRGRFFVETAMLPELYLPSGPEVGRVIEDCR